MLYRIFTERRGNLAALVGARFEDFALIEARGYWRGVPEDAAIIEVAEEGEDLHEAVMALAAEIKATNNQEAVLIQRVSLDAALV
jgi:hypothetical protein